MRRVLSIFTATAVLFAFSIMPASAATTTTTTPEKTIVMYANIKPWGSHTVKGHAWAVHLPGNKYWNVSISLYDAYHGVMQIGMQQHRPGPDDYRLDALATMYLYGPLRRAKAANTVSYKFDKKGTLAYIIVSKFDPRSNGYPTIAAGDWHKTNARPLVP